MQLPKNSWKTFQACRESGTPTSAIPLQRSNQMSYEIKVEPQAFYTVNDKPKFPHLVVAYGRLPNIRGENFDCEKWFGILTEYT